MPIYIYLYINCYSVKNEFIFFDWLLSESIDYKKDLTRSLLANYIIQKYLINVIIIIGSVKLRKQNINLVILC